ncbi:MAG TPA: aminotransferase class I/II-fold pyridoxal phosphate-dependent enzyme [Gemmatimonadota bacterium]|nr:aminotransferase class I/II-fold pyridoxal phosphate-dependent enzyme [Gemmatimonadota bacterium]
MSSERLGRLPPYPLQDVPEIRARLAAEGRDVLDLGAGDSGLPVPEVAVETLRRAAGDPAHHGYAFQRGLPAFRESVAAFMERRFGAAVDPWDEVLPVIGSKEAIALTAFALLDPGDTVLIPDPGYAPYFGGAFFAGAHIERVPLRPENGFLVPPERIREAPGRLKLVYLNYPNNPTAAVADAAYLRDVVEACRERGARLVYDNAYSELTFGGWRAPGLFEIEGGREIGLEFHSFSKTFNMTGWRLGWVAGGADVVGALKRVKTFFDTGSFLALQAAGAATLDDAETFIRRNVAWLEERRDAAVGAFRSAGFTLEAPAATLYLWMPVPGGDSHAWCRELLEREAVVLMPGAALGAGGEGFLRASLTLPTERYAELAARLERFGALEPSA